jgi:hypothetical protein
MICKLCHSYFLDKDDFFNIFSFNQLCPSCKEYYKPNLLYEVIPIHLGEIEYYYLYEHMALNLHYQAFLSRYLSKLFTLMIEKKADFDLFIYLDDSTLHSWQEISSFLSSFRHIFMFSLNRKDLMYKDLF